MLQEKRKEVSGKEAISKAIEELKYYFEIQDKKVFLEKVPVEEFYEDVNTVFCYGDTKTIQEYRKMFKRSYAGTQGMACCF